MKGSNSVNFAEISWCMRAGSGIFEYTHLFFDKNLTDKDTPLSTYLSSTRELIDLLKKEHASQDMLQFSFCLYQQDSTETSERLAALLCPQMKKTLNDIAIPEIGAIGAVYFIVSRSTNYTLSKLGIHYDILDIFTRRFSRYIKLNAYCNA